MENMCQEPSLFNSCDSDYTLGSLLVSTPTRPPRVFGLGVSAIEYDLVSLSGKQGSSSRLLAWPGLQPKYKKFRKTQIPLWYETLVAFITRLLILGFGAPNLLDGEIVLPRTPNQECSDH